MHIVFVDDTKQNSRRSGSGKLVAVAAVVFAEDQLKPFADDFWAAYDQFGVPHEVELKWALGENDWFRVNEQTDLLSPLREAILDSAQAHDVKIVVVVWDIERGGETMQGRAAEANVLRFMFERVSALLENAQHLGIIVFDKPGGDNKAEDKWIADTLPLTELGTEFVKPNAVPIPIVTAPSHHHPHLQLADLVAGSVTGAIAGNRYGLALMQKVKPMLHRNFYGYAGMTGLKLYPDSTSNLLYWVLDEDTVWRRGSGHSLPHQGFPWVEDDGLPSG